MPLSFPGTPGDFSRWHRLSGAVLAERAFLPLRFSAAGPQRQVPVQSNLFEPFSDTCPEVPSRTCSHCALLSPRWMARSFVCALREVCVRGRMVNTCIFKHLRRDRAGKFGASAHLGKDTPR